MVSPGNWRWYNWVLFAGGLLLVAGYYGLLSWAPLEQAIERMANQPGAQHAFETAAARQEALFVIFAFLLLTPLALLVALFVLASVLSMVLVILGPVTRVIRIPDRVVALLILAVSGVAAYVRAEAWWPWLRGATALVARAFLVVR